MALFRKLFHRKPPDGLLEISERVYVFDCCFTTDVSKEDEYKFYIGSIVAQLQEHFPDTSFMVFNFREGDSQSQISSILSEYEMTVMDYPRQFEGCPLLSMEMIHHFLRSSESWLSLSQHNILLMHCELGGWPVLAFMLAALLVYHKQYAGEWRTLDMIYKKAPCELMHLLSPLNPLPSQLRYLHYISRRNSDSEWPPLDRVLTLDCVILRFIPDFYGTGGHRPLFRIYGQDPLLAADRTPKVLFSTPKKSKLVHFYKQGDCELVKIDIHCHIQGDVVLQCISLEEDLDHEEMMFRVMFNTAFVRSNILMLDRDALDILWDVKDRFPKNFRVEVLLSVMDTSTSPPSLETFSEVKETFNNLNWLETKPDTAAEVLQQIASSKALQDKLDAVSLPRSRNDIILTELGPDVLCGEVLSSETTSRRLLSSFPKRYSVPLHKISDSNTKNNIELHGLQIPKKLPSQIKIISQRIPVSRSTPAFSSNSIPGFHPTVSRYHSASSDLGIMALLDDHASDTSEVAHTTKFASALATISASGSTIASDSRQRLSSSLLTTSASCAKEASLAPTHCPPPQPLRVTSSESCPVSLPPLPKVASLAHLPIPSPPPSPPPPTKVTSHVHIPVPSPPPPPPPPPPPLNIVHATKTEACDGHEPQVPVKTLPMAFKSSSLAVPPSPAWKISTSESHASVLTIPSYQRNSVQSLTSIPSPPPPPLKGTSSYPPSAALKKTASSSVAHQVASATIASKTPPNPPPPPLITSLSPNTDILPLRKGIDTSSVPSPPPPPCPAPAVAMSALPRQPHILSNNSGGFAAKISAPSAPLPPAPPNSLKSLTVPNSSGANGTNSDTIPPPPHSGISAPSLAGKGRLPARTPNFRNLQSNQSSSKKSNLKPLHWIKVTRAAQGSLWAESLNTDEFSKAPEFDMSELESLFSAALPSPDARGASSRGGRCTGPKSDKVHLIDLRRANNCEIMLTKVKMPLNDLMSSVLALDDSVLDADQVDNLIKFCPTKEEMELLKGYDGDRESLGKCEQYFLELMKVPRVESKLRVFSFKIQFRSLVADLKGNLNIINSASQEIRSSVKLKRIMQTILCLGNALNQGTARGSAVGFRLDSLLKLTDTRARNNKMTLMHYLCKVLAEKLPELLDFPKTLVSLEAAARMQLKILAEEMQAINKGLEKVEQELTASEHDGPVSQVFRKMLKEFLVGAEAEVIALISLYSNVGRNADALALYFGEDPARCPFEQVVSTLLNFVKMFTRAHEENRKRLEVEKKKAQKEVVEKPKMSNSKKEQIGNSWCFHH
ncbi:formin-like protein 18 [Curcuma longa]|uniref:formin-like protein 18 n=1 Tax=Curcuma longa TaxID=136217 RepID=UPI003D9DFD33